MATIATSTTVPNASFFTACSFFVATLGASVSFVIPGAVASFRATKPGIQCLWSPACFRHPSASPRTRPAGGFRASRAFASLRPSSGRGCPTPCLSNPGSRLPSLVRSQYREERFLRNLDAADLLHALLAFLLFLQQLLLARNVAAVALRKHVLAQRLHRGACDDLRADRGLDRHVEHLPRNQFVHPLDQVAATPVCLRTMHDQAECVHPVAVDQHVHAHERAGFEAVEVV